ncbi:MAG: hypothetical protein JRD04_09860 [Deltaproteobacteria bacterium]|nr:hypothetical protein [Deltaproteobacteria bacterium]
MRLSIIGRVFRVLAITMLFSCLGVASAAAAEKLRVGALRLTSSAPLFIAVEKGYFADDGRIFSIGRRLLFCPC